MLIRYFAVVGIIALFGEMAFNNVAFRIVIAFALGCMLAVGSEND